ncbi:uncharacterized protein [Pyxicephalus adspersus]|uniref:uncharacterized protein isoform X2 n=1 Tax=Pyxicephalus adspersus TaxID=30357 RepID=UPI003B5C269B
MESSLLKRKKKDLISVSCKSPARCLLITPYRIKEFKGAPLTMSEGWEDWPLLGPGWKRRIAVRKSGQSCGHSDTYYQSPTGQRFRSKPELAKFLGESVDLSCFNFKHGTLIPVENRKKSKKKKKSTSPSRLTPTSPVQPKKRLSFPLETPDKHKQNGTETKSMVKCCTGCKSWFSGVEFGRSKQTNWYCANCRVSRRTFNKEQMHLKPGDCGVCQGCTATEDCEACLVCLKRQQNPKLEINNKCVKRTCHKEKPDTKSTDKKDFAAKKLKTKWTLMSERDGSSLSAKNKKVGHRKNRKCDTCEACQRELDCGDCDFCQDKPKFGGRNLKRQKCRWRQCLRFAAEKNIPVNLKSSNHPVILERLQREKLAPNDEKMETLQKEKEIKLLPKLPIIKLERLDYRNGVFRKTEDGGSWIIGKPEDKPEGKPGTKPIKQEREENNALGSNTVPSITVESKPVENNIVKQEVQEEPMNLHCPVKTEEFIAETDDVEAADESTPVITQIFSFATLHEKNGLDQVLQEFLTELNEIPLPAHWEVLSNVGPTLQLVQRSKASTMAETVVHIQPGLHYHIVVREYTVPSFHELFQTHPSRLTTVDEVVELICDLEAYRPCAGLPREGPRSPNCQVLVYEEWCQQCSINPWPSGFVR